LVPCACLQNRALRSTATVAQMAQVAVEALGHTRRTALSTPRALAAQQAVSTSLEDIAAAAVP
jgi:hypothetical protein